MAAKVAPTPAPKTAVAKDETEPKEDLSKPANLEELSSSDESDSDDLTSSDEDSGPPPMIHIERSSDIGSLKKSFLESTKDKKEARDDREVAEMGKDKSSQLATQFEQKKDEEFKVDRERLTLCDREKYSNFKNKFENIQETIEKQDEHKKKLFQAEIQGVSKEKLSEAKTKFEKGQEDEFVSDRKIDVKLTEADKQRVKKKFDQATEKEEPKDCAVCGKTVYSAEKVKVESRVFHRSCFKCCKCSKGLSVQNYYPADGQLYCRTHVMEVIRPDSMLENFTTEGEAAEIPDEEEEYALVSRPKVLDPSVVKSGLKSTEDLGALPSLKSTKNRWTNQTAADEEVKVRTFESDTILQGKVKSRLSKFTEGTAEENESSGEESDDDSQKDPNITRESKKKEKLKFEVGNIKSKWEKGDVEKAAMEREDRHGELEEIKRGVNLKERFKERGSTDEEPTTPRKSILDTERLDFKSTSAAKEKFAKGDVFEDKTKERRASREEIKGLAEMGSVKERFEKGELSDTKADRSSGVDVKCGELGNLKANFEGGKQEGDESAEEKKKRLEMEFKRYKKEKRIQAERERREAEERAKYEVKMVPYENPDDVKQCAEMGSIKKRFEEGTAYKREEVPKTKEELETKVAGKAREKFRKIDEEGPKEQGPIVKSLENSKWNKEVGNRPEPINKRSVDEGDSSEGDEGFEVTKLLSKFKNIEQNKDEPGKKAPKPIRAITPPPADYKAEVESQARERDPNIITGQSEEVTVKADAKNLKKRFEHIGDREEPKETEDEKRKRLEEEFKQYKELKEQLKEEPTEVEQPTTDMDKEELNMAAEHAQKMRHKWEKIQRKEAKKAQKAASMKRAAQPATAMHCKTPDPEYCVVCDGKVYMAEKIECDTRVFHKACFKCKYCRINLRMETYAAGADGIYCKSHYLQLFNNMSRCLYDGRSREMAPVK